jgi:predicted YcjX-like family ATPase
MITLFPGAVPASIPTLEYWQKQAFNYIAFSPIESASSDECLPHLRMDQMLQFLLGDKLT